MSMESNSLLRKKIVEKYDYGKSKEKMIEKITDLEEARYRYGNIAFPSITSNFEKEIVNNV